MSVTESSPTNSPTSGAPHCCIVGIAGGSASGKTTLTRALKQCLEDQTPARRVEMLSLDTFFIEVGQRHSRGPTFTSPTLGETFFNFNHPDALDRERLFAALSAYQDASDSPTILLLEGLMTLHFAEIRDLLDVRIFVELEADIRALRRMLRDMQGGRGNSDPNFIASYYLESARVGHECYIEPSRTHADLIVRGDANPTRIIPLLAAAINTTITGK